MPKVKTSEIKDLALDWAVAKGEDVKVSYSKEHHTLLVEGFKHLAWFPSKSWSQGGPIIEREKIQFEIADYMTMEWRATRVEGSSVSEACGPTHLVAAMRAFVLSQLGDEVEIPEELV